MWGAAGILLVKICEPAGPIEGEGRNGPAFVVEFEFLSPDLGGDALGFRSNGGCLIQGLGFRVEDSGFGL
jgi:hypothetical protein